MTSRVAIIMGSLSDLDLMRPAQETLRDLGIESELRILSAHRTPEQVAELAQGARARGIRAIICGAGAAAHLAGAVAAQTHLPVIGVPLARTPLAGQDALLATVQMPKGMPVATVAIDGAANAAILAAQIIALDDEAVLAALRAMREAGRQRVLEADKSLRS